MAVYTNNLAVEASIIDPITKVVPVYPVKDAYLSQAEPVFPHGIQKSLILNNSTDEDFIGNKIIMAFDVPKLKDPQYENLISVTLELQCITTPKRDVNIGIKYHTDNNWVEDGITWLGQPQDNPEYIQMKTLPANATKLVYDITDVFTSHQNTEFHLPLTIMEQESNTTQRKVQFYSREAGTRYSPVLKISYAYFAEMMDAKKIDATVKIRRCVPDNNVFPPVKAPELRGTVEIEGGISSSYFPAKGTIPGVITLDTHSNDPKSPYYKQEDGLQPDDLNGTLVVRKNIYNFMPDFDNLAGNVTIRQFTENIFPAYEPEGITGKADINIYVTRKRLPSDGRWVRTCDDPDENQRANDPAELIGNISIKTWHRVLNNDDPDSPAIYNPSPLDDEANIHEPAFSLPATVNVGYFPKLEGHMMILKYHAVLNSDPPVELPSELDGSPYPYDRYIHANEVKCTVKVRRYVPSESEDPPKLDGHLAIAKYFAVLNTDPPAELPSEFDGEPEAHFKYVRANDVKAVVTIRRNVPNETEDAPEIKDGKVFIKTYNCTINNALNDFVDPSPLNTEKEEFYPAKDLEGAVRIRDYDYFPPKKDKEGNPIVPGNITIHEYFVPDPEAEPPVKAPELNGHIMVIGHRYEDLGGHISIPKTEDLGCHLETRARGFSDLPPTPHRDPVTGEMVPGALPGKITIDSASNGAYAFIIV